MNKRKIVIICVGILLAGVVVTTMIFFTEPTAKREGATRETAMLVDVVEVEQGDFQPVFSATGTVQPVEDVMLSPLVGGQIVRRSPAFTPGGFVKKNEILLQIDPSDYRNTLELRKSELQQSQTNLNMEMGRQQVAEQDLALIGGDSLSDAEKSLVLRRPQLDAVKSTVKAGQASVAQAELNLDRTTLRSPFDAHILSQNVTVGSQVSPGDNLGRLVGTEHYWVVVNVAVDKLKWLSFPGTEKEKGSLVKIMSSTAWGDNAYREGYLHRQVGALDDQTRLARVLVRVADPLANEKGKEELPRLMIGAFVDAQMRGDKLEDVVRLPRDYLRSNQTVWVMEDGKLSIREVNIVLNDSKYTYINKGLSDQDLVVTTNLSTVTEGIGLRTQATDSATGNMEMKN